MKKYIKILILAVIVLFLDQTTKILASNLLEIDKSLIIIPNFFSLTYTRNYGAAWSIMWDKKIFLIIISLVALIIIFYILKKEKKLTLYKNIYYGFLIGGILGNLIDRVFYGYVIDFFDFNIFGYNFPIFNISDSFIVIGVILIFIEAFIGGKDNE